MTLAFTADGLTIQTYDEIYAELVAGYQAIYGTDINTDADSPDGQRIGIEAKARLDAQAFALALYNQFDPDLSSGEMLNKIIKLSGITRRAATRSSVDVTITVDRTLTLPDGYAVEDDLGQSWITTAAVPLTDGAHTVTLVSEDFGAVEADAGTITEPATIVIGVVSVTNPAAATVGIDEETDADLRIRRNLSLQNPATSTLGGLFSALGNRPGVTGLAVYENDTAVYDATLDLNAHSIWCVIEGGTVADLIETIAKNKTAGAGIKGTIEDTYLESLPLESDPTHVIVHTMRFDRPTAKDLYVRMDVIRKDATVPVDDAAIAAALAALTFRIAQNAIASELYSTVYTAGTNFVALNLEISDDGLAWTDGQLLAGADGKFEIDVLNVTVTDVTP